MPMKTSDLIAFTPQRATTADALNGLERIVTVTNQDHAFALALMEACEQGGIDFAIAWAHACNETDWLRDTDYTRDNNAFGIGHPDSAEGGIRFGNVRECARFYVGEMLLKLRRPVPPALADARSYAPVKWDGVEAVVGGAVGPFPVVRTIDDLNERFGPNNREAVWMTDPRGPEAIVSKGNALFVDLPDQEVSMPIPTIPVHWTPVPAGAVNNPAGMLLPGNLIVVWHENGNPNSDADDEARFLLNGGGEGRVSYHFAVDHEKAYQMFALNELCWHAADGCNNPQTDRGCFRGVAMEHCQDRDPAKWAATKRNGAILTAMIISGHPSIHFGGREGDFSADRIETHQAVSETNKHCPDWMLNEGAIPGQIARVKALLATPSTTTTAPPTTEYPPTRIAAPDTILAQSYELIVNDPKRFKCVQGGRFKTAPSDDAPDATPSPYRANRSYTFDYQTKEEVDGEWWLVSKAGSWAPAKNFGGI